MALDREPQEPKPGAAEVMPPAPAPAPRVVLVDEAPFKPGAGREEPETHAHHTPKHGRHGRPYHPAPGIVVDVTGAHGGPTDAELQRAARNIGYWPFRHCYEEGLRRDQKLGGSILVPPSGARPARWGRQPDLEHGSRRETSRSASCARRAGSSCPGERAHADSAASMKVTALLDRGRARARAPKALPHGDELRQSLRASWPKVEQCYAGRPRAAPRRRGGRLALRFRTKATGEILEVTEDAPRFGDVDVTRCVLGVYRTATLPRIHGAHGGDFEYAMHFEAAPLAPAATASR